MSRAEAKSRKKDKCEYCRKDKKKSLMYCRGELRFCNHGHWRRWKKKQKEEKDAQ